ncbi:hypothetical protein [Aurantimonas sp. VKM B-3413]|uniref:hypothetical protein n=1 Tax=Aurantimonas sp. VKM B-3413 TaxID=2779401 RepID=UPI001E3A05B1|nr:hypothetical protein [Aurantimonas sp. VKM B-3413]MCB8838962.1 hypothetical protein [Aurantimonas sp. VKM B-3413]
MLRSEASHPFYRPLWVRICLLAALLIWTAIEWWHGESFWGVLSSAAAAWAVWTFFLQYDPAPAGGSDAAAAEARDGPKSAGDADDEATESTQDDSRT